MWKKEIKNNPHVRWFHLYVDKIDSYVHLVHRKVVAAVLPTVLFYIVEPMPQIHNQEDIPEEARFPDLFCIKIKER